MPAEERIRLDKEKRLFPPAGCPREYNQDHPICLGAGWALHLAAEDDELLTKQGVFGNEFRLGTGKIGERAGPY